MSKVSIIMPVHNMEAYLSRSVASLQGQTLTDIEIILVENGSTDNSIEICNRIAAGDSRVKVIHLDKGDVSVARNAGVAAATSEYIGFMDSDDLAEPEMYAILYGLASENNLDVMYANFAAYSNDTLLKYHYSNDGSFVKKNRKGMVELHFTEKIPLRVTTLIVRSGIMKQIPFPEGIRYEDRAMSHMIVDACRSGGYLNKALMRYTVRQDSAAHTWTWKHSYDYCLAEYNRLLYLDKTDVFNSEEKIRLAEKPSCGLLNKLRYLHRRSKTEDQKRMFREMSSNIRLIPAKCRLPLKSRIIKGIVNKYYL